MIAKPEDHDRADDDRATPLEAERGPTVLRIALGGQLRRLREQRGVGQEAAGEAIRGSHAKISRLETGRTGFKERDVRDLLTLYGVHDTAEREAFVDLARQANQPGWWHRYGDLTPSWFETYLGLEQAARSVRTYETQFVPGLLQTSDYARSVVVLRHNDDMERRVAMRMERQKVLDRADPPAIWAVLDESTLLRPVGGAAVWRQQLKHLIEMAARPNITIQVMPYSAGGHAAAGGSFSILRFDENELPDIVYIEHLTSAIYLDKRTDLELYLAVMDTLSVQANAPEKTPEFLARLLAQS